MLIEAGYHVQLQFAAYDSATQISHNERMIKAGAKVLAIPPADGDAFRFANDMVDFSST